MVLNSDTETISVKCPKCGREIELNYDWMVAFYVGECPYCHKQMGMEKPLDKLLMIG